MGVDSLTTKREYQLEAWLAITTVVIVFYLVKLVRYLVGKYIPQENGNGTKGNHFNRLLSNGKSWPTSGRKTQQRIAEIEALADKKESASIEHLLDALESRTRAIATAAYSALQQIDFPEAVKPLINALDSANPLVADTAMKVLGRIGDVRALPKLLEIGDKTHLLDGLELKGANPQYVELDNAIEEIRKKNITMDFDFVCHYCFHRYHERNLQSESYGTFSFYTCRNCGSDAYRLIKTEKVILFLDSSLKETYVIWESWVYVNWLVVKTPFDYDEIEIRSDEGAHLEEMVMILNNDMDETRRKKMKEIPVKTGPGLSLSQAKKNLLIHNFKQVID